MKVFDGNWQAFLARTLVFGGVVFGAVKLAVADPGGPASPNSLTYSGVLRNLAGTGPLSGAVTLSFVLRRADGTSCPPVMVSTTANANGAFSALVSTAGCPSGFFNGDAISYDVNLVSPSGEAGPLTPDGGVAVTPVPYARFADQAGVNNDCPAGYTSTGDVSYTVCRRQLTGTEYDEVVKVGRGATAFWIDRYESAICASYDGACGPAINSRSEIDLATQNLPRDGRWRGRTPPLFARSTSSPEPPARWVTWFQADALCRASGKRLPTGEEWLAAARGTGGPAGDSGCQITGATEPRGVASSSTCVSDWGAQDMVGNVAEWTSEWYAGVGGNEMTLDALNAWPADYHDDRTWNIRSSSIQRTPTGGEAPTAGAPTAAIRGGAYGHGSAAGAFALDLRNAPSFWHPQVGFRCVVTR